MSDTKKPSGNGSSTDESSDESRGLLRRLVRVELLTTVLIVLVLLVSYAYFFLDDHLEWAVEYAGGRALGAQVDVEDLRTGWVSPALTLEGLAVTDPKTPSKNWIELDVVSARLSLDALLRAKVVVEESELTGLRFSTERDRPGWVSDDGGDLRWVYDATTSLLTSRIAGAASGTVMEDAFALVGGSSVEDRWEALRDDLEAPRALKKARENLETRRQTIRATLDQLPARDTLKDLRQEIQELRDSKGEGALGQVDRARRLSSLADRLESLKERTRTVRVDLGSTLDDLSGQRQQLEAAVARDRRTLRDRISVEGFSVDNLSSQLFQGFLQQRGGSLGTLFQRLEPYVSRGSSSSAAPVADPPSGGKEYRFGGQSGYPGLWVKRFDASGTGDAGEGLALEAGLRHFSTEPLLAGEPMELTLSARPPEAVYSEVEGRLTVPASDELQANYDLQIRGWQIRDWTLLDREDVSLVLEGGIARFGLEGVYRPGAMSVQLGLQVRDPRTAVQANQPRLASLLRGAVGDLGVLELRASGEGSPDDLTWSVQSNLGPALERGLRRMVQSQVDELRASLEDTYRQEVGSRVSTLSKNMRDLSGNARDTLEERENLIAEIRQSLRRTQNNTSNFNLDL